MFSHIFRCFVQSFVLINIIKMAEKVEMIFVPEPVELRVQFFFKASIRALDILCSFTHLFVKFHKNILEFVSTFVTEFLATHQEDFPDS